MIESYSYSPQPEKEPNPTYDAMLVHGFWLSQKSNGKIGLSTRSKFAVRAAYFEYKNQEAKKIVFTCGPLWGKSYPSVGSLMAQSLVNNFHVPQDSIVLLDEAYSTKEEIDIFTKWAHQSGANRLLDIAPEMHHETIPQLYSSSTDIHFKSVESILLANDQDNIADYVRWFSKSRYAQGYRIYTEVVKACMKLGLDYDNLLNQTAKKQRQKKAHPGFGNVFGSILPPIDRYDLKIH